ncbi:MAG: nucleoside hydrolase [Caldilineaceae bacterium]
MSAAPTKLIIDCDPGVDDAMALLLTLASPELAVVGVTTLFGNGPDVAHMARNAGALLQLAGRTEIPVAVGANRPLMRPYTGDGALVHGANGLGGADLPAPRVPPVATPAAWWIVEQARAAPGEITLVTLASLTNVALALQLEPHLPTLILRLVMMGGAVNTPGNVTPVAEANVYNDPEAAHMVFAAGWEIVMAGLNVTCAVTAGDEWPDSLRAPGQCERALSAQPGGTTSTSTAASACPACVCTTCIRWPICCGPNCTPPAAHVWTWLWRTTSPAGKTVADFRGQWDRPLQTDILETADGAALLDLFMTRIATLP